LELGGELLVMKDLAPSLPEAKATLEGHLTSGSALERFRAMIAAQGGALEQRRTRAASWTLTSNRSGFVSAINGEALGLAIVEMGGGRQQLGQQVDHAVGLEILVRLGDYVERGQGILTIFASTVARSRGLRLLEDAIQIRDDAPSLSPLILERIRPGDVQQTVVDVERGQRLRLPELVGSAGGPPAPGDHGTGAAPDRSGRQQLIEAALHAREAAYAPYSQFRVGAAVVSKQGNVYLGANVENASYGLTICAERVALSNAIAAGEREFKALAIASPGGVPPCGACRQFAAEFEPHLPLILVDADLPGRTAETDLGQLLPGRFELRQRLQQDARDASGHEAGQGAAQHGPQPEAG
jgi:homotetrameric cytidine deaminase